MVAGERIKKDAQIDKADLIRIEIVLFVQLWHLRNGWHDAHKADLISLWSVTELDRGGIQNNSN